MKPNILSFRLSNLDNAGGDCAVFSSDRGRFRETLASAYIDMRLRAPKARLKLETAESVKEPCWISVFAKDTPPLPFLLEPLRWECAGDLYDRAVRIHAGPVLTVREEKGSSRCRPGTEVA